MSDGFFRTLGVAPALGRDFYAGEDLPAAPPTVIISHAAWHTRFGARRDVIGQTVTLSGAPHTIVGVLLRTFSSPLGARRVLDAASRHRADATCGAAATP